MHIGKAGRPRRAKFRAKLGSARVQFYNQEDMRVEDRGVNAKPSGPFCKCARVACEARLAKGLLSYCYPPVLQGGPLMVESGGLEGEGFESGLLKIGIEGGGSLIS